MERSTVGQLVDLEPLATLDEDVETPVLEPREHLGDPRSRPDVADAVAVRVDEPELGVLLEALLDELLVALLEDVERESLGRQEHDAERKQAELVHVARCNVVYSQNAVPRRTPSACRPCSSAARAQPAGECTNALKDRRSSRCPRLSTPIPSRTHADVARVAEHDRPPCEARGGACELDAVGRAADDSVEDDDVGGLDCVRVVQHVDDAKRDTIGEAHVGRELPRVRLVRPDELDDLPRRRTRLEQLGLNRADATADLENSSSLHAALLGCGNAFCARCSSSPLLR